MNIYDEKIADRIRECAKKVGSGNELARLTGIKRRTRIIGQRRTDGMKLHQTTRRDERWEEIKHHTVQGGSNIIKLRGRSSFQSPAYNAVKMIEAAMGGEKFTLPAGCFVKCDKCGFKNVMMAMPTTIDKTGVHFTEPTGTEEELASLAKSYEHLCKMRDEIVELGIVPPVAEWKEMNPNL